MSGRLVRSAPLPPLFLVVTLVALSGCNLIIGADAPNERSVDGLACVLNSDCAEVTGTVCIFRVCSAPCRADGDCSIGSRCLRTQSGTACVDDGLATCSSSQPCPQGTSCTGGVCRNACGASTECLGEQTCASGTCVGTSAAHDPVRDGGNAGDGHVEPGPDATEPADAADQAPMDASADAAPNRVCAPNDHRCNADGIGLETCGSDGQWGTEQACPFVCTGGTCGGVCTPGGKQCNGTTPQSCGMDGIWASGKACTNVCANGACAGSCTPDTRQCSNLIPESCNGSGAWVDSTACPYVCSGGACTGVCTPNDTQCDTASTQQTCSASGQWATSAPCPYVCTGKTCGGVCTPGDTRCDSDTLKSVCGPSGTWQTATTCPDACVGKVCGGSCVPASLQCNVNEIQSCDTTGAWQNQTACGSTTPLCRSNTCVASTPYTDGNATQLGNATDVETPNILLVIPITVANRTSLLRFGMWGRTTSPTANVIMAIYAESTIAPGAPGALVMSSTPTPVVAGKMEMGPAQATNLPPGKYWIGAVYSAQANTTWSSTGGPGGLYVNDTYPTTPSTFPTTGVTSITGYTYNYYIVAQDY